MSKDATPKRPGTIVREARRRLGATQAAFGAKLGRSQSLISKYERGSIDPPGAVVVHCLGVLGGAPSVGGCFARTVDRSVEAGLERLSAPELRSILMGLVAQITA